MKNKLELYGDGPWVTEPDRKEWECLGLKCLILRNFQGVLCGYVAVPPGHPWYGKHYDEIEAEAHGGLTYSGGAHPRIGPKEPSDEWMVGFDCGHSFDYVPVFAASGFPFLAKAGDYRDIVYVTAEVEDLARQAWEAAH